MTLHVQVLKNAAKFLERVNATGQECYAWCEAHAYLLKLVQDAEQPPQPANPVPNADGHQEKDRA